MKAKQARSTSTASSADQDIWPIAKISRSISWARVISNSMPICTVEAGAMVPTQRPKMQGSAFSRKESQLSTSVSFPSEAARRARSKPSARRSLWLNLQNSGAPRDLLPQERTLQNARSQRMHPWRRMLRPALKRPTILWQSFLMINWYLESQLKGGGGP